MPKRIGKYEITSEIGRGDYSRVYRGVDPSTNWPIALKIATRSSNLENLLLFNKEAAAAQNLRHENIAALDGFGDERGAPYLAMELLEGRDLRRVMRDEPDLSVLEKMRIMSQVAEGLGHGHANGSNHGNLKPSNVMVLPSGRVQILDFGCLHLAGTTSTVVENGSPLYYSPEKVDGHEPDAVSDIWSFGVLYFELMTGQHPFLSQDRARLIRNIQIVNPPSVHSLIRWVPESLAHVIRRALTKDPRRRYQTLQEVLAETSPIQAVLQREESLGMLREAHYYRRRAQLLAARQSTQRALQLTSANYGLPLLPAGSTEMPRLPWMEEEVTEITRVAEPAALKELSPPLVVPEKAAAKVIPPPPEPIRIATPAPVAIRPAPEKIEPEVRPIPGKPAPPPSIPKPAASVPAPVAPPVVHDIPVVPAPPPAVAPLVAAAAAGAGTLGSSRVAPPVEVKPAPVKQPTRPEPTGIAAALEAARLREANRETPAIKPPPAIPSAPAPRMVPPPPAPSKRPGNGSGVFVTNEPLVVRRPLTAVLGKPGSAPVEPAASVAGSTEQPKVVPPHFAQKGKALEEAEMETPPQNENLPVRLPPKDVYGKDRRRNAAENGKKPFPWAIIGFVLAVVIAAVALVLFSWSAPKYGNTPVLSPEKMAFTWKADSPLPPEQTLTLRGGSGNASFTATSDQDWLLVSPAAVGGNRSWHVRVEPEKLGTAVPNTYTGWIDIASREGFKTQAEVTLKIGGEPAPGSKGRKTPDASNKAIAP